MPWYLLMLVTVVAFAIAVAGLAWVQDRHRLSSRDLLATAAWYILLGSALGLMLLFLHGWWYVAGVAFWAASLAFLPRAYKIGERWVKGSRWDTDVRSRRREDGRND